MNLAIFFSNSFDINVKINIYKYLNIDDVKMLKRSDDYFCFDWVLSRTLTLRCEEESRNKALNFFQNQSLVNNITKYIPTKKRKMDLNNDLLEQYMFMTCDDFL